MKIFIVTQTFPPKIGGMQILMSSIADGLSKLNFDVTVFPDHHYDNSNCNFKVYYFFAPKIVRPLIKKTNIYFRSIGNEIFICDSWKSVSSVPRNKSKIICFALAQELFVRKQKNTKIQKAFNRCNKIIPISNFTYSKIKSDWVVDENKIRIINPTFSVKSKKVSNKKTKRKLLIIFSLCRIEKRKGLFQVANSLIRLKKILPEFKWFIGGTGPEENKLKKLVFDSCIAKNVIFEGKISEKKKDKIFRKTDLFIMPSYQEGNSIEGYGITFSEAASYGIPSIGGIEGGAGDAIINNMTGWCINPKSNKEIDSIVLEALNNNIKRLQFGKNALKYFNQNQTSHKVFKKLINLFN